MHIRTLLLGSFTALAVAQSDVLTFTRVPNPITDGEVAVILYATNDTNSPVTIKLRQGQTDDLDTIYTITSNAQDGQYIWHPPLWIPNGDDYALEISQRSQVNYFGPLTVQGASPDAIESKSIAASISASLSRSISRSMSISAANATMTGNSTMTRNSTTTTKKTPKATNAKTTTTKSGSGAGQTGTKTGGASGSSSTPDAAPADYTIAGSSVALGLGAIAALFYLQ